MSERALRLAVVSFEDDADVVTSIISGAGCLVVDEKPDFVVCYGGDGTVLYSERVYPAVPKICIKKEERCKTCNYTLDELPDIIEKIKRNQYFLHEEMKLVVKFGAITRHALNEVQLHNKNPARAIRFSVKVEGEDGINYEEVVGDGVVVSTPFGSSAYYYSVGGSPFDEGIGLAFNNPHNVRIKPKVLSDEAQIWVKIIREEGYIIVDNDEDFIDVKENDTFIVKKSPQKARFVVVS